MSYSIRKAMADDMPEVLNLIKELAVFEKEPDAVDIVLDTLVTDGFGENPLFQCFVAEKNNKILGMALVYPRYSTWKGMALHLEDLIVSEKARGKGIGGLLLDEVIKYGHKLGVNRISWEVLNWNEGAIRFYQSKGALILEDWNLCQLNREAISNYIKNIE